MGCLTRASSRSLAGLDGGEERLNAAGDRREQDPERRDSGSVGRFVDEPAQRVPEAAGDGHARTGAADRGRQTSAALLPGVWVPQISVRSVPSPAALAWICELGPRLRVG